MVKIVNKKKVLILGCSGFIGYHLFNGLDPLKYDIYGTYYKKIPILNSKKIIKLSINNNSDLKKIYKINPDIIINAIGYINHSNNIIDSKKIENMHYTGIKNLFISISKNKSMKCKLFIQIGSSDEYGKSGKCNEKDECNPITYYGKAKYKMTKFLSSTKKNPIPYIVLRPFILFGRCQKRDRLIPSIITNLKQNKNVTIHSSHIIRNFLKIDYFVNLISYILINPTKFHNKIFNIGSRFNFSLEYLANLIHNQIKLGSIIFLKKQKFPELLTPDLKKLNKYYKFKEKNLKIEIKDLINSYEKY